MCSQAAGREIPVRNVIEALVDNVQELVVLSPSMAQHVKEGQAQRDLINDCVRFTMRSRGIDTHYSTAYEIYQDRAAHSGMVVVSLKRFQNVALVEYGSGDGLPREQRPRGVVVLAVAPTALAG